MFSRSEAPPNDTSKWTLRQDKADHAVDFPTLRSWFAEARIASGSKIYDPDHGGWRKPEDIIPKVLEGIVATTGPAIDGRAVERYIDVESLEIVVGTGIFSEFGGDIADFFGSRSTAFELKMQNAKRMALQRLKLLALQRGGDAVIAIDLDYTEFSGNRVGVIVNGTIVKLRP